MKLELKHLAAYMPYGLKFQGVSVHSDREDKTYEAEFNQWKKFIDYSDIKPILRPLSDLDKPVKYNGKTINPFSKSTWVSIDLLKKCIKSKTDVDYKYMELLFELHFDVFGLIKAGLAIDINTLNNQ